MLASWAIKHIHKQQSLTGIIKQIYKDNHPNILDYLAIGLSKQCLWHQIIEYLKFKYFRVKN